MVKSWARHGLLAVSFTRRHTAWLICSLTHLVNWYVSHFKSYIFIMMRFCALRYSCLHAGNVKGVRSKPRCLLSLCNKQTERTGLQRYLCKFHSKCLQADRFTTVWRWDLWSLCFAECLYSLFGARWHLNNVRKCLLSVLWDHKSLVARWSQMESVLFYQSVIWRLLGGNLKCLISTITPFLDSAETLKACHYV